MNCPKNGRSHLESTVVVKRIGGKRVVGNLTGPGAQLLWSPQDIEEKFDGKISASKVRNDLDDGTIPDEAITQNGRIKLIQNWFVRKHYNIKST